MSAFFRRGGWVLPALLLWVGLYASLRPAAEWLTGRALGLDLKSHLGSSVAFFLYDAPKVAMLLSLVVFGVTFMQTWVKPEAAREALRGRREGIGNVLASGLGIITPFCSCSAVPLFIGFVRAGIPLGVTFSYLVAAPMVNEVALILLFATFGWKIALLYATTGVSVALIAGWILGRMNLESQLEDWVRALPPPSEGAADFRPTLADRLDEARVAVQDILGKVWPYLLVGIGVGALIHGYVPEAFLVKVLGRGAWWSVPLAVVIGVPLYANAATILPVVQALLAKGAALGPVLAFMMAVTGLSLPETILLRKVLKPRLIATFLGVVTFGILAVGFVFLVLF
jgi:uncharacterized membrane protein YraQ (UPF0718 family)